MEFWHFDRFQNLDDSQMILPPLFLYTEHNLIFTKYFRCRPVQRQAKIRGNNNQLGLKLEKIQHRAKVVLSLTKLFEPLHTPKLEFSTLRCSVIKSIRLKHEIQKFGFQFDKVKRLDSTLSLPGIELQTTWACSTVFSRLEVMELVRKSFPPVSP